MAQDAERGAWEAKAASMRFLINLTEWDTYTNDLRTLETEAVDEMIQGDKAGFEYLKGKIAGLRLALGQPEVVINAVKEAYTR